MIEIHQLWLPAAVAVRVLLFDQRSRDPHVRRYDDDMARRPWIFWILVFLVIELLWLLVWLTDRRLLLQFVS